ncbi:MAG: lytic murein transglycosylase, partial [Rubrobacter sp.]
TDFEADIEASEERSGHYERDLLGMIAEVSEAGERLQVVQSDLDATDQRVAELEERTRQLSEKLRLREEERKAAEEQQRAALVQAYQDGGIRGLDLVLEDLLDGDEELLDPTVRKFLFEGQEDLEGYREAERLVEKTFEQVEQTRRDQQATMSERQQQRKTLAEKVRVAEVAQAELRAEISTEDQEVETILVERRDYQRRLESERRSANKEKLRRQERARIDLQAAATGGESSQRQEEIQVAEKEIYVSETEPTSYSGYMELYRGSAERYGFAEDWYILAAIGKVESDHGSNLGPSSAGAMGPMQFLPSTWATSGVDGNGDGEANIMDPEDAIPAAAGYLVAGGAPEDWYAALYSYNHADWYVRKVLTVAEGYEQLDTEGNLR